MMTRQLFVLSLMTGLAACSSVVDLGTSESSTTDATSDAGSSSGEFTTVSDPTTTPNPTATTSGAGSTTGGSDGSTGESDSCFFLGCEETETVVVDDCGVFEQDCPEGEKCMPWANDGGLLWNATRCVPIAPDAAGLYEPCTVEDSFVSGVDSCDLGMICWNLDEQLMGTCYGMCGGSENAPTCEDATASCIVNGGGVLPLCIPSCDPLDIEACQPGEACYPTDSGFVCVPDASDPKLGGAFDPCEFTNACDPGLFCGPSDAVGGCGGSNGCCTPYCDLSAPLCPEPSVCLPFFPEGQVPPGYENVGACMLDPG